MKLYNIPTLSTFDLPASPLAKVSGGEVSAPGEFPHNVGLYSPHSDGIRCGGAILSAYLILTAAHCIHGKNPRDFRVIAGEHNRKKRVGSEQARLIKEFYMHENYTGSQSGVNNDIALIVLNAPLVFTDEVKNISLPRANEEFTGTVEIMGFGHTSHQTGGLFGMFSIGRPDPSELLLKVQVPIISYEECAANYSTVNKYVTRDMFCAGLPGKDSCKGDSGGSTLCKRPNEKEPILCGIVSWGIGCGSEGFPGVNTKVSRYIDWIQNAAKVLADRRKCQTHEFSCSGSCIPRTKICDGTVDCYRGLDEMGCHNSNKAQCEPDQLRCDNGNCVKRKYFCDGDNDCKDNSDELKCPSPDWTCNNETEFKCGHTGRCIPKEWKCDGRFDCDDLSDENETCSNFNSTAFQIHSATTTEKPPEASTKPTGSGSCPSHKFYCPHSLLPDNCAPLRWRCDGDRDCLGGIDEANCSSTSATGRESWCPSDKFYCPHRRLSDNCAPRRWLCDGDRDCLDGRDELNCSSVPTTVAPSLPAGQCPTGRFYCPGSRFEDSCAPLRWKCDDKTDCTGGSDEEGCPPASERCPAGRFFCPGNARLTSNCAALSWRCDGDRDCRGGVDEENCRSGSVTTTITIRRPPARTTTSTSRPTTTTRNPSTSQCELGEFYCPNNRLRKCIPLSYRCDGDDDCVGGYDEKDCNNELEVDVVTARPRAIPMTTTTKAPRHCASSEFQCADGSRCLPTSFKCDGDRDCLDGSDEASCSTASVSSTASDRNVSISDTPCPSDRFECPMYGSLPACVPLSWKCDGESDCPGGFDERDCSSSSTTPATTIKENQVVLDKETSKLGRINNGPIGYLFNHRER